MLYYKRKHSQSSNLCQELFFTEREKRATVQQQMVIE